MLHIVGDINLTDWHFNVGFGIGSNIAKGLDPFKYIERNKNDIWVGNFEGVASSVSVNKGFYRNSFRVEPDTLSTLHHFDYCLPLPLYRLPKIINLFFHFFLLLPYFHILLLLFQYHH